jgi:hypothetical protein
MTAEELLDRVAAMLGFQVTERENDAVLIRDDLKTSAEGVSGSRSVRPATREELMMFVRMLGLVAQMDELQQVNAELQNRIAESSKDANVERASLTSMREAVQKMGLALQAADARIKGLAEEREAFAKNHTGGGCGVQAGHKSPGRKVKENG